jgi:hypothetical protein
MISPNPHTLFRNRFNRARAFDVFGAMTQYTIGKLIDRYSLKAVSLPLSFVLAPFLYLAATLSNLPLILAAIGIVMGAFGQVTVNDAMVGKCTSEEWRSRGLCGAQFRRLHRRRRLGRPGGVAVPAGRSCHHAARLRRAVPAGDRGGNHPADRNQGAGGGREPTAMHGFSAIEAALSRCPAPASAID